MALTQQQVDYAMQIAEGKLRFFQPDFRTVTTPRVVEVARDTATWLLGNGGDIHALVEVLSEMLIVKYGAPSLLRELAMEALRREAANKPEEGK